MNGASTSHTGEDMEAPSCPECGAAMTLKTARRGRNAGGQFWGCSSYPDCRGTRDHDGGPEAASSQIHEDSTLRPRVSWFDGTMSRRGWIAQHLPVGGGFRAVTLPAALADLSSGSWIAYTDTDSYEPTDDDTVRVCSMVRKLLQRGRHAPVDPMLEKKWLDQLGLDTNIRDGDLAPQVEEDAATSVLPRLTAPTVAAAPDATLPFDSDEERAFLDWVASAAGPEAAAWITPQAPLGELLRGVGADTELVDARRVDFLAHLPGAAPFVIEIDGLQHRSAQLVDEEREEALAAVGIPTIRIPAAECRDGHGPGLDAVAEQLTQAPLPATPTPKTAAALGPAHANRLTLALLCAVEQGFLLGDRWVIRLAEDIDLIDGELLASVLGFIAAVDDLWGGIVAPQVAWFDIAEGALRLEREGSSYRVIAAPVEDLPALDVDLLVESATSPTAELPTSKLPTVVARTSLLPVEPTLASAGTTRRVAIRASVDEAESALHVLLAWLFAKPGFREGQREALTEVLHDRDCVVLLPTGAGKSLIYQMAGLLLPGVTIIVDPIIALMEDQIRGLAAHGIDRVLDISSFRSARGESQEMLQRVGAGDVLFAFISPERLQQPGFRSAVTRLSASTMVNLAVVDEAHCVSEWGHDFRTSYMRIGAVLRRVCADADGEPPPILALTGTASRAVLRDVLFELEIDAGATPNTLIRPRTFDRPELQFDISVGPPENAEARLLGAVESMPAKFQRPGAVFFQPNGDRTFSGIVFCPHVNGAYGVADVADMLRPVVTVPPGLYSGSAPKKFGQGSNWGVQKRRYADDFTSNRAPVLVATNSFGMGIDKPNIRWVTHYGIPRSIEAYYQEAGRAGRDGRPARCTIVFTELDEDRARDLLDAENDVEVTRDRYNTAGKGDQDDITRALFFHFNTFKGLSQNLERLEEVLDELLNDPNALEQRITVELPFGAASSDKEERERALHRLVVLGVVNDYTVDWGRKAFEPTLSKTRPGEVRQALLDFVGRTQPARVATVAEHLRPEQWDKPRDEILACGRELMEFVYDTIERSRRRSLREMWLAARQGDGDELRRRILDYLSEGDAAPVLEQLLDRAEFRFIDWTRALDPVLIPDDAAEWRGNSGRLLVSEPDHPGLLLARAVSELSAAQGDPEEFRSNLTKCLRSAVTRYRVDAIAIEEMVEWLFRRLSLTKNEALRPLVVVSLQAADLHDLARQVLDRGRSGDAPVAGEHALGLQDDLETTLSKISNLLDAYTTTL